VKRLRARFTTRSLMIVVALVGLNLAGAIATSSRYTMALAKIRTTTTPRLQNVAFHRDEGRAGHARRSEGIQRRTFRFYVR
jgi:hypothetical protein